MIFNNKYQQKEIIGKGEFGTVYKVLDDQIQIYNALKFIQIKKKQ